MLGMMYHDGIGGEHNLETAIEWFKRAAALGCQDTKIKLLSVGICLSRPEENWPNRIKASIASRNFGTAFGLMMALGTNEGIPILTLIDTFLSERTIGREAFLSGALTQVLENQSGEGLINLLLELQESISFDLI